MRTRTGILGMRCVATVIAMAGIAVVCLGSDELGKLFCVSGVGIMLMACILEGSE